MRRALRRTHTALRDFIALEAASGIVMIAAAAVAIALANSPLAPSYRDLIHAPLPIALTVSDFVKDILMAVFFFAIGMELKLEMREGTLAARGQKLLPLVAALGGILTPALIYLAITHAHPEWRAGWAIPTATDIAFALCVLRLVGPSVPPAAKSFLLAIAIYDDLAAIVIIAVFYASGFAPTALLPIAAVGAALYVCNRRQWCQPWPYLILGVALWVAVHRAGIHPTVAGVLTGIAIPLRNKAGMPVLAPLLQRLHPAVAFGVLPLFAFTSAGVDLRGLDANMALGALPLGIAFALVLGKPLGIVAATRACVALRIAPLPASVGGRMLLGMGVVAGIGFTMSLFIGQLAFPAAAQDAIKLGVLGGSLVSAVVGLLILRLRAIP